MKGLKKAISAMIVLCMLLAMLPVSASAATEVASGTCGYSGDNLTWVYTDDGTLTISGSGAMAQWTSTNSAPWASYASSILTLVIGDGVTSIGHFALKDCIYLNSVTLPQSLLVIGNSAFRGCTSLTIVSLPQKLQKIGSYAFSGCSNLTSVSIPDSVTSIGDHAFLECRFLQSINIPKGVTAIDQGTFNSCGSLQSITLPEGVTSIGWLAFNGCSSLQKITFTGDAPTIDTMAFSGVTATAYYSPDNATWTSDVMQNYGGTITWKLNCVTHSWGEWTVITQPTCTEKGIKSRTCSACGDVESQEIAALGHNLTHITGKAPTCTESGYNDFDICSRCDYTTFATVPATGHTAVTVPGKAATCTETGLTDGTKCSVCGVILTAQTEIAAKGHTEEIITGKAATCTETGLTDGTKCSVCGEILTAQKEIAAKGHTEVTVPGKAATCSETGLTEGTKCSVCNTILVAQKEIPLLEHQSVDNVCTVCGAVTGNISGTCGYNGDNVTWLLTPDGTLTISGSGPMSHTTQIDNSPWAPYKSQITKLVVEEGVTNIGHYSFYKCTNLKSVTLPQSLLVIGNYAFYGCTGLTSITIPKSVTTIRTMAFYKCTSLSRITFMGNAPSIFDKAFYNVTATAYYPADNTTWTEEVMLDYGGTITWEAPCTEHTWGEWAVTSQPTCTKKGVESRYCSVCGNVETREEIPAKGHTEETIPGKAPTDTETGLTEGKKCSVCGEILVAQQVIPATGVTVSGTVTSFGGETEDVTIQLIKDGETEPAYTVTVQGKSAAYSITGVAPGTYTMKVSKTKHAAREYTITVASDDVTQDAQILLYGDVTGDGLVNSADATQINRYFSGKSSVIASGDSVDGYRLLVADVYSTDHTVNATDATQIKRHFSGKSSVFTDFA
ncbi:MAG: leucine-rich repeat protein [Faecousia sp.]